MSRNKYILYLFGLLFAGLLLLLGWNCGQLYRFERKQVQERVQLSVGDAAFAIQNYNGSLVSNMARMLIDEDYNRKMAFAIGFTHNRSKFSIYFENDTVNRPKVKDKLPVVDKAFLKKYKITYNPSNSMSTRHFDSVFRAELKKNKTNVPYKIVRSGRVDSVALDSFVTEPFILDFAAPDVYSVHYRVPFVVVLSGIVPYLVSSILIYLLLLLSVVFYYRSYQHQKRITRFKEVLFGNFAHELKTPVTSLQLIVDSAKSDIGDTTAVAIPVQYLYFADSELKRMKLLIDKILSFGKMDRQQFEFNKEAVDIGEIINEAIAVMQLNIERAGAIVSYKKGPTEVTIGDKALLLNSLIALLDNALKYSGTPPRIVIVLASEPGNAIVSIKNNGQGIENSYGKKIFEPFFRIPTDNVQNIPGHGLGLSFVAEVMKLHGSEIQMSSNENGTTFYFRLVTV